VDAQLVLLTLRPCAGCRLLAYAQTNPVFAAALPHVAGALADFAAREARRPDGSIGVVLEYVLATTPPG